MRKLSSLWALCLLLSMSVSVGAVNKGKPEANNDGIYIVLLEDAPLATYKGGVGNFKATSPKATGDRKLKVNSPQSKAYLAYLASQQDRVLSQINQTLKARKDAKRRFAATLNGFTLQLSEKEVAKIRKMPGVKQVMKTRVYHASTDRGPNMINAPSVWNGVFNATQARGEGVVVGIIDTGIVHDHPSFAGTASDGYVHTNPLGNGVYLGDCVATPALCNSKLIGSYNMTNNGVAEDEHGHGTHVAGTAIGNPVEFAGGIDLSGVAPRANVIAYKIADGSGSSGGGASTNAIDQAVLDGVDVINYSFGGGTSNPWNDADAMAYLAAREAGIVVMTSAGNSGPSAQTVGSPADAPWLVSVGATTHDRGNFPTKEINTMSGGDTAAPGAITGRSLTGSITANIVYAGDYDNGDPNPEQCLNPFPANTFNGEIVLCDRGEIARVDKATNVAAGGAGGFILANVSGGATNLADDIYDVPGIHIASSDGDAIRTWLASGTGHTGTITGVTGSATVNPANGDIVADFSSRGPNINPSFPEHSSFLVPALSAPGASILAADVAEAGYGFKSGTSMASPHAAGAAALLVQLQPTWTAGQIQSALATTGEIALVKEDGSTTADAFDIGGGRIDVLAAAGAGLLVDETITAFEDANPGSGGTPDDIRALNLPSVLHDDCVVSCTISRTFTAAAASTWTGSVDSQAGVTVTASPMNFTLAAGETVTVDFTISVGSIDNGSWAFNAVTFTPNSGGLTATRVPVIAKAYTSTFEGHFDEQTSTSSGSEAFTGIRSIGMSNVVGSGNLVAATSEIISLAEDTNPDDAFDNLNDGVTYRTFTMPANTRAFLANLDNTTATDMDLYIGIDANADGLPALDEVVAYSLTFTALEEVQINAPAAGNYWILVQNYGSGGGNTVRLSYAILDKSESNQVAVTVPATVTENTPYDVSIDWSGVNTSDSVWYGSAAIGDAADNQALGFKTFAVFRAAESNPPVAGFDFSANNLSVTFTNTTTAGNGALTYSWDFGDGDSATTENPSHTYSAAGTYSVTLTVTDSNNDSDSITRSVTVTAANNGGGSGGGSGGGGGGSLPISLILALGALGLVRRRQQ
ncbi:MAG: S8 family serine peptidase [Gammaproteobacteria bacterium]|nr:S8 family serine peptidase [Gammaproteobacteria bacterium]